MNDKDALQLSALVSEFVMLEPKPNTFEVDWDTSFSNYLNGSPNHSKGDNWWIAHHYEEGDEQTWMPKLFALSIKAAYEMEEQIAKRELMDGYVDALVEIVCGSVMSGRARINYGINSQELFALVHATPEERCRAALKVVGVEIH